MPAGFPAALEVRDLVWSPQEAQAPVIDGASFAVEDRSLTVMIGPSGCGKSSLGYLVAGFLMPDAGTVLLDGAPVRKPSPERLMVFQESALWPWMSVRENVGFGPVARGETSRREADRAADALLERFGLLAFADRFPGQLSGGMKRRVDIAQALINRPRLLILDEPFRGLDVMTRELMQEYYLAVFDEDRVTTLFITSEVDEAVFLADRVLVAGPGGRIVETVEVDLPRPRREEQIASEEFQALRERLLDAIDRVSGEDAPEATRQTTTTQATG